MAIFLKLSISDPMLVKPKCVWEAVVFFLKNCKQTAEKCKQIFQNWKKTTVSQTHFGFTNIGSEMHSFRGTAIWNQKLWFRLIFSNDSAFLKNNT